MKKFILTLLSAVVLAGCGVGTYTISTGRADEACLSFADAEGALITVRVDGTDHRVSAVKEDAWRKDRDIRATVENTIYLTPGKHSVEVYRGTVRVFGKTLFISAGEHKVVNL